MKGFAFYLATTGSYGFYRGWNNLYNNRQFGEPHALYTDRFWSGMVGAVIQANPVIAMMSAIYATRRLEMRARGLPLTKEDYEW